MPADLTGTVCSRILGSDATRGAISVREDDASPGRSGSAGTSRYPRPGRGRPRVAGRPGWRAVSRCRARQRAARCRWGRAGPGGRRRWPAAPGRTWTARCAGGRTATAGPGAGPGLFAPCLAGGIPQSATHNAPQGGAWPEGRPIISVDALLRLAGRLLSSPTGQIGGGGGCPESAMSPPVGSVERAARAEAGGGGAPAGGLGGEGRDERGRSR